MKKLHVFTPHGWHMVFCRDAHSNRVITGTEAKKALPSAAHWGLEDLRYFQEKFSDKLFCLKVPA